MYTGTIELIVILTKYLEQYLLYLYLFELFFSSTYLIACCHKKPFNRAKKGNKAHAVSTLRQKRPSISPTYTPKLPARASAFRLLVYHRVWVWIGKLAGAWDVCARDGHTHTTHTGLLSIHLQHQLLLRAKPSSTAVSAAINIELSLDRRQVSLVDTMQVLHVMYWCWFIPSIPSKVPLFTVYY